jgi:hypothetical protein
MCVRTDSRGRLVLHIILLIAPLCPLNFHLTLQLSPSEGGLGFSSGDIGVVLLFAGASIIAGQALFVPKLVTRFGCLLSLRHSLWPLALLVTFPAVAHLHGASPGMTWVALVIFVMYRSIFMTIAFTAMSIAVNNSSRGVGLGAINGVSQSVASATRAIIPAVGGALFSTAVTWRELGDLRLHVVYLILAASVVLGAILTLALPSWINEAPDWGAIPMTSPRAKLSVAEKPRADAATAVSEKSDELAEVDSEDADSETAPLNAESAAVTPGA